MNLSVRDAASLLNVSEKTIYRWIQQQVVPAYRVQDQYRFNRAELLEWATSRKLNVSSEIFLEPEADGLPIPSLVAALEPGGVHYRVSGSDKVGALREVVQLLRLPDEVDRAFLLRVLLAREAIAPTAIGDGIAIPHVRNPVVLHVGRPSITLCFLDQAIDYGALDGKPVHSLFTIISPTTRAHLHLMSRLAFVLRDPELRCAIERQESRPQLLREVARAEEQLAPSCTHFSKPYRSRLVALGRRVERVARRVSKRGVSKIPMQLTVRDVSKFLKVSDSTVTRWIKQRGLPTHQVGGRFHFNRVELLEWATANESRSASKRSTSWRRRRARSGSLVEAIETGGIFHHIQEYQQGAHAARLWSRCCRFRKASTASYYCGSSWLGKRRRARQSVTASRCRMFGIRLSSTSRGRWSPSASSSIPSTSVRSTASPCTRSSR